MFLSDGIGGHTLSLSLTARELGRLFIHFNFFVVLLTRLSFLQLRLNSYGHIIGTEYLTDLVEKEHEEHQHGIFPEESYI